PSGSNLPASSSSLSHPLPTLPTSPLSLSRLTSTHHLTLSSLIRAKDSLTRVRAGSARREWVRSSTVRGARRAKVGPRRKRVRARGQREV
ncbi:hypothetical protein DACRYDRAFT_24579, partial [Dacryopinax primogenitus]